jgi:hypothetical protein
MTKTRRRLVLGIMLNVGVVLTIASWAFWSHGAYERLARAPDVTFASLGGLSQEAFDFQVLVRDVRAGRMFEGLAREGTPATQIYALCGLYHRNRPAYEKLRNELAPRTDQLEFGGCLRTTDQLGFIVKQTDSLSQMCMNMRLPTHIWLIAGLGEVENRPTQR